MTSVTTIAKSHMKTPFSQNSTTVNASIELLAAAIGSAKDSIIITDTQLDQPGPTIVYVNASFTKMTGYTAQEVIGKSPRMLQGPETDRQVINRIRTTLSNGEWFDGKAINYRKDGSTFINEWHIEPIMTEDGQINHFLAIQHDVTERERIYQALEDKNRALHEMLQQIEREKQKVKDDVRLNIEETVLPTLNKLKRTASQLDRDYLMLLENNLRQLMSSFGRNLIEKSFGLSPREVEIATMIRQGLATKGIALALKISEKTTENHRSNIRQKMGIQKSSTNLNSYLLSL
jgi:PAS domain S-box-containing protein